jgi:hypothetical protein
VPDYPVYEKNGKTQIAATPQREIELQFDGWQKQSGPATPASDDTGSAGAAASSQAKQSKSSK